MDLGTAHVAAACVALVLGAVLLRLGKGSSAHVRLGRVYVVVMLVVTVPALLVYDETGRPGPFHVLAVVSLVTVGLGWSFAPRRRLGARAGTAPHGSFMLWSYIGLATAGVGQLLTALWPELSPWPVLLLVTLVTAVGFVLVPRAVRRAEQRRRRPVPAEVTEPAHGSA